VKVRVAKLPGLKLRFVTPPPKLWPRPKPRKPKAEAVLGTARAVAPSSAAVPRARIEVRLNVGVFLRLLDMVFSFVLSRLIWYLCGLPHAQSRQKIV
jgi:hypothetical protein